jgi:hypothetical protein
VSARTSSEEGGAAPPTAANPADLVARARRATLAGDPVRAEELFLAAIAELEHRIPTDPLLAEALIRLALLLWFHSPRDRRGEARHLLARAAALTPTSTAKEPAPPLRRGG